MTVQLPAGDLDDLSVRLRQAYALFRRGKRRRSTKPRRGNNLEKFDVALDNFVLAPASFDWRDRGMISPAKDQLPYNTCASFAIAGAIEAMLAIGGGEQTSIDPGFIHTCLGHKGKYLDPAVDGQMPIDLDYALSLVQQKGYVSSLGQYPFPAANCPATAPQNRIRSYQQLASESDPAKQAALKGSVASVGPVIAEMFFYQNFFDLRASGQPYTPMQDSKGPVGHVVIVVGYTAIGWIIKNSFGAGWGNQGFAVIRFGDCGIDGPVPATIGECRAFSIAL